MNDCLLKVTAKSYIFRMTALDVFDVCIPKEGTPEFEQWGWLKDVWGFKLSIPGFFWAKKFDKYIFWWLDLSIGTFGGFLQLF